jgi:surface antigen
LNATLLGVLIDPEHQVAILRDNASSAVIRVRQGMPLPGGGTPILPVAQNSGLSCVPFARMATGMNISGDARLWWHNAAGTYARGQAPERGAVLAFMSSGGMARGHVGVVSRVVNPRTILLDHANWGGPGIRRGSVMRNVAVVDVSDRNDWTSVRVQVGHTAETFGRTYPTHGFIYNRPAGPRLLMAAGTHPSANWLHQRVTAAAGQLSTVAADKDGVIGKLTDDLPKVRGAARGRARTSPWPTVTMATSIPPLDSSS